ncbi:MAG: hypothetical protein JYX80_03580 [Candidatus Scalindua sediminis]|nr:hypothetical protein [Candidatus Scalindua sediminis]
MQITNKQKGLWRDDPFLRYIKGYSELENASFTNMELSVEVNGIQHALFPLREKPIPDRPGYCTRERDYFKIIIAENELKQNLEKYFLEEHFSLNKHLYGQNDNLGSFFGMICRQILVTGRAFYAINWDAVEVNQQQYILPSDFKPLIASTMHILKKYGYKQKFSLVTYLLEKGFKDYKNEKKKPRTYWFNQDEIFFCKYPFSNKTPTKKSLKYLPKIKKFHNFTLEQLKSNIEVTNHHFPLERARHTTVTKENRKYGLARSKIRTNFNYLLEYRNVNFTQYYDVYTVIRYKKYLNDIRNYIIDEFNKQIFQPLRTKNNLSEIPVLEISGFLTNTELDLALKDFTEARMSFDEYIEKIVKHA